MNAHFLQLCVKFKKVVIIRVLTQYLVVHFLLLVCQAHIHKELLLRRELLCDVALVPSQQYLL